MTDAYGGMPYRDDRMYVMFLAREVSESSNKLVEKLNGGGEHEVDHIDFDQSRLR